MYVKRWLLARAISLCGNALPEWLRIKLDCLSDGSDILVGLHNVSSSVDGCQLWIKGSSSTMLFASR